MEVAVRSAPATAVATGAPAAPVPAAAAAPQDVRRLARGKSMGASAGITLAAILLAAVAGVRFWASREQAVDAQGDAACDAMSQGLILRCQRGRRGRDRRAAVQHPARPAGGLGVGHAGHRGHHPAAGRRGARHAFVAQATHELRTPLTNIRLYVETAIEDGETDPSIRATALNVINADARRLERIVGEMLSVAEIEAGAFKLNVDDVRLEQLLDDLKRDYDQPAREKRVTLTFLLPPKLPVLQGDRDKVAVALHNLVGNALKYTPAGGGVTVRVEADDKQFSVAVADTGIGIAADDCERIFERFYRANDGRVAKITGTGLGLTIDREVARLHGGDITVESQLNKGSTFRLALPMSAAA